MIETKAAQEAERLNREHPERDSFSWVPFERGTEWSVAKVRLTPGLRRAGLEETVEAQPKPPESDDPRPSSWRAAPPFGGN